MAEAKSVDEVKQTYYDHFTGRDFLRFTYPQSDDFQFLPVFGKQIMQLMSEGLESVPPVEGRVLDICSGPSISSLMPVSKGASELVATGFLENERKEIKKWFNKDPDAYEWKYWLEYAAELEGDGVTGSGIESRLRAKVKGVLPCDVHLANPIHPHKPEPFDVIMSQLTFEAACPTGESFLTAAKNVTSLLKPGGRIILLSILENTSYKVNDYSYNNFPVTTEFVQQQFEKAGIQNIIFKTKSFPLQATPLSKAKEIYFMHGVKKA